MLPALLFAEMANVIVIEGFARVHTLLYAIPTSGEQGSQKDIGIAGIVSGAVFDAAALVDIRHA